MRRTSSSLGFARFFSSPMPDTAAKEGAMGHASFGERGRASVEFSRQRAIPARTPRQMASAAHPTPK